MTWRARILKIHELDMAIKADDFFRKVIYHNKQKHSSQVNVQSHVTTQNLFKRKRTRILGLN